MALCQFTPGAASSKVGIGVGLTMGGLPGAVAAWIAFTLPSALALVLFGYGVTAYGEYLDIGVLHGLKVVAVAVVALAVWGMAKNLCPDAPRATMAVGAALLFTAWPTSYGQIGAIAAGALIGLCFLEDKRDGGHVAMNIPVGRTEGAAALALFFALLFGLPLLAAAYPSHALAMVDSFYRTGSLVFGGGHVVLPLIQSEVVPPGWVDNDAFLAGYGAAQAVPGPLFTFSAYLGTVFEARAERLARRADLPGRHLPAVLPVDRRRLAVLGGAAAASSASARRSRRQRGGGRPAAGRALQPGVDQRNQRADGFRPGAGSLRAARVLEMAALAGRRPDGARRLGARRPARMTAPRRPAIRPRLA